MGVNAFHRLEIYDESGSEIVFKDSEDSRSIGALNSSIASVLSELEGFLTRSSIVSSSDRTHIQSAVKSLKLVNGKSSPKLYGGHQAFHSLYLLGCADDFLLGERFYGGEGRIYFFEDELATVSAKNPELLFVLSVQEESQPEVIHKYKGGKRIH